MGCSEGSGGKSGGGGFVEAHPTPSAAEGGSSVSFGVAPTPGKEEPLGCGMTGWVEILDLDGDPVDVAGVTLPCEPFLLEDLGYPHDFSAPRE
jgi:hypothetical protein